MILFVLLIWQGLNSDELAGLFSAERYRLTRTSSGNRTIGIHPRTPGWHLYDGNGKRSAIVAARPLPVFYRPIPQPGVPGGLVCIACPGIINLVAVAAFIHENQQEGWRFIAEIHSFVLGHGK
jgi:hypothetical protein